MKTLFTTWKEIAAHLGRNVRTLQRWEKDYGLPVHRPAHKQSRVVIADKDELDAWLRQRDSGKTDSQSLPILKSPNANVEILQEIGRRGPSSTVLTALIDFVHQHLSCEFAEISLLDHKLKIR